MTSTYTAQDYVERFQLTDTKHVIAFNGYEGYEQFFPIDTPEGLILSLVPTGTSFILAVSKNGGTAVRGGSEGAKNTRKVIEEEIKKEFTDCFVTSCGYFVHKWPMRESHNAKLLHPGVVGSAVGPTSTTSRQVPVPTSATDIYIDYTASDGTHALVGPTLVRPTILPDVPAARANTAKGLGQYFRMVTADDGSVSRAKSVRYQELQAWDQRLLETQLMQAMTNSTISMDVEADYVLNDMARAPKFPNTEAKFASIAAAMRAAEEPTKQQLADWDEKIVALDMKIAMANPGDDVTREEDLVKQYKNDRVETVVALARQRNAIIPGRIVMAASEVENPSIMTVHPYTPACVAHFTENNPRNAHSFHRKSGTAVAYVLEGARDGCMDMNEWGSLVRHALKFLGLPLEEHGDADLVNTDGGSSSFIVYIDANGKVSGFAKGGLSSEICRDHSYESMSFRTSANSLVIT